MSEFRTMFTGIIETTGEVVSVENQGTNRIISIKSNISNELKVDQSVSHNGICLTIEESSAHTHQVTAVQETIEKTNIPFWKPGTLINLERCLSLNSRLDGHIVQGHVDETAQCISIEQLNGSHVLRFKLKHPDSGLMVEKGSVCINGISLTLFNLGIDEFSVTIIPYTYRHTNISTVKTGDWLNIEFDLIGKYIQRIHNLSEIKQ